MNFDCGWAGKILWMDLSSGSHFTEETAPYLPDYLGGRGLAAKIAWDHLPTGIDDFDEKNLLMFMTGPLGGTLAPSAGRGYVFGMAPQAYPPHYTRSGFGGRWSSKLKYAGYDGLIIKGKADSPSILFVNDEKVELMDGKRFFGLDAIETQKALQKEFGQDVGLIVIGPAGEHLVRLATIQSGANCAAGQGGFGAVMGSKNLKAIVIRGSGGIKIANMEGLLNLRKECARMMGVEPARPPEVESITTYTGFEWKSKDLIEQGEMDRVTMAFVSCPGCLSLCRAGGVTTQRYFKNVPGVSYPARVSGAAKCVEWGIMGWGSVATEELENIKEKTGRNYRYNPGFRSGFEIANLTDRYGLNAWEFCSIQVWLTECKMAGVDMEAVMGMPFEENGPLFWQTLLRKIAYREGFGEVLAEGMARAADQLGEEFKRHSLHAAYGYAHHGLGKYNWAFLPFPYWIPVALMWSLDTRDPMSDTGHKYCFDLALNPNEEKAAKAAEKFYEAKDTLAPRPSQIPDGEIPEKLLDLAYSDKEMVAFKHQNRAMANGCLILCDGAFPFVFSPITPDGNGDTAMEAKLLEAVTGLEIDEAGLDRMGETLFNLERNISIRDGKTERDDLSFIPAMETRGDWTRGIKMDGKRYRELLKKYYLKRGWDPETGQPAQTKVFQKVRP